jgi:hypothetical protein
MGVCALALGAQGRLAYRRDSAGTPCTLTPTAIPRSSSSISPIALPTRACGPRRAFAFAYAALRFHRSLTACGRDAPGRSGLPSFPELCPAALGGPRDHAWHNALSRRSVRVQSRDCFLHALCDPCQPARTRKRQSSKHLGSPTNLATTLRGAQSAAIHQKGPEKL